jgi:hypothetical protein
LSFLGLRTSLGAVLSKIEVVQRTRAHSQAKVRPEFPLKPMY